MIGMAGIAAYVGNTGDMIMAGITGYVEGFGSGKDIFIMIRYDVRSMALVAGFRVSGYADGSSCLGSVCKTDKKETRH